MPDVQVTKFLDDFGAASDDVLRALNNKISKIEDWKEWDTFITSQPNSYWANFKNVPPIPTVRKNALRAMAEYPDDYVKAIEDIGLTKSDLFTRHGVDYGDEFWNILNDFKTKNAGLGLTDTEIHSIFGYTTNFFYYDLNLWLRAGTNTNKTAKMKQLLNGALTKLPQWNGNIAYRGLGKGATPQEISNILARYGKGTSVPHGEFTSCGSIKAASHIEKSPIEIQITLKAKSSAKDISDLADGINYRNMPKHELALPTETTFYVDDIYKDQVTSKWIIKLIEQ